MHRSIKKYIFIGLGEKQINLVKSLNEEYDNIHEELYFIFMPNTDELFYHLDVNSVVISNPALTSPVIEIMLKLGHPFYITWQEFLQHYHSLLNVQRKPNSHKICLAFVSENFMKLYRTIFTSYGYNVTTTGDPAELEQIINSGVEYLVFDMDMERESEKIRFETMQKISFHCKKGGKVNVIKNFDKGSLFNDILSPVKEISNILLSPEEYVLFLRKYLYVRELESFYRENPERINAFQNNRHVDEVSGPVKIVMDSFSDIRDGKKCYNQILSLKNNVKWNELLQRKNDIDLRFILSAAIEKFVGNHLGNSIENSQRELFTFFPS